MDLSEPQELCIFQTGNHSKDLLLCGKFQMVLKSHDVVTGLHQVFLPKLHNRVWRATGDGIVQADRTHGTEAQRIPPATCELFNRKTRLEVACLFEFVNSHAFGGDQCVIKGAVLFAIHRAVQIIIGSFAVPACAVNPGMVDRLGIDDRTDGVIKIKMFGTAEFSNRLGE